MLQRSVTRAKVEDRDRIFWILMRITLQTWRETLMIMKPDTVISVSLAHAGSHRKGWCYYWRRKSRKGKLGRPRIALEVIELIRRISVDSITGTIARRRSPHR